MGMQLTMSKCWTEKHVSRGFNLTHLETFQWPNGKHHRSKTMSLIRSRVRVEKHSRLPIRDIIYNPRISQRSPLHVLDTPVDWYIIDGEPSNEKWHSLPWMPHPDFTPSIYNFVIGVRYKPSPDFNPF